LSWSISEKASAYLNVGFEDIEAEQAGSETFSAPDWRATHDDDFTTVGVGFRVRDIAEKVDLQMDYIRSDGTSEIIVDSTSSGQSEFPELSSELDYVRFNLAYRRSEQLEHTVPTSTRSASAFATRSALAAPAPVPKNYWGRTAFN
jgi:hypothetical protein